MRPSVNVGVRPIVSVSEKAECFARDHSLWGSLVLMKSLILQAGDGGLVEGIDVDVVRDPEVGDKASICFIVRVNAPIAEALELDQRISGLVYEEVPRDDQTHFVVRFEFLEVADRLRASASEAERRTSISRSDSGHSLRPESPRRPTRALPRPASSQSGV
jgi:hypothetical protein